MKNTVLLLLSFVLLSYPGELSVQWDVGIPLTATSAIFATSIYLVNRERPVTPDITLDDSHINAIDRGIAGIENSAVARVSDYTLSAAVAVPLLVHSAAVPADLRLLEELLIFGEVIAVNNSIVEVVKAATFRARPLLYSADVSRGELSDPDNYHSFYSGYAGTSFAAATAVTMISAYRGYAPARTMVIGSTAFALAGITAALRVVSGRPFLTDVITGASMGTATSYLVVMRHEKEDSLPDWLSLGLHASGKGVFLRYAF
jgi:hypothetical protein